MSHFVPASQGKVGVSAMCILGYNTNKGQEIALRLRTDDMQVELSINICARCQ